MNDIPSKIKEQLTKVIIGKDELIGMIYDVDVLAALLGESE